MKEMEDLASDLGNGVMYGYSGASYRRKLQVIKL